MERLGYTGLDQKLAENNDWEMAPQVNREPIAQGEQTVIVTPERAAMNQPAQPLIQEIPNPSIRI